LNLRCTTEEAKYYSLVKKHQHHHHHNEDVQQRKYYYIGSEVRETYLVVQTKASIINHQLAATVSVKQR
jgi:hypothetical protein